MAFTSAFFDAELVGGEYDRVYSAEKFAEYFASFIANGVFPDPSTNLQVVANTVNDMNVLVSPGMGWINGYYCKNDDSYPLAIQAANGTLNRIDAVVVGWSRTNREITPYIKTGIAASSPTAPPLTRNTDLYELMLATITVNAGVTKITQSMITDKRGDTSVCGWVAGVVQQIDTTHLFAQYDAAFQAWFEDIQAQLEGNVATNLLNRINAVDVAKVNVSDKATKEEAIAGTSTTKWMTPELVKRVTSPLFTAAIGDVYHSANNIEQQTNGKFIKLDGRVIDVQTGYPLLNNTYELKYRVAPPNRVDNGNTGWSQRYDCTGVYLNGRLFFVAEYNQSTNSSYYHNLMMMTADGTVTRILNARVYGLAVCNNTVIAFTGESSKARAVVFSATGTQLRDISLNTSTNFYKALVYCDGTRAVVLYPYNGCIYGYYSSDSFSTFGTVTFDGVTQLGGSRYLSYNEYSCMFNGFQKVGSILYIGVTGDGFRLYKSTDNGASFSLVATLTNWISSNFFIHNGYLYLFGNYNETSGSNTYLGEILRKYNMSNFSSVGETGMLYSGTPSYPSGFIRDNLFYLIVNDTYRIINLDTLSVTNWVLPNGVYPYFKIPYTDYITNDGEYYFAYGEYMYGLPTYAEFSNTVYGGVLVVHIPSGGAVYITSPFNTSTSGSSSTYRGKPFEDADGNVYIATGYYTSDDKFKEYSMYKFSRSERKLPSLDYAYIKAKEVTL